MADFTTSFLSSAGIKTVGPLSLQVSRLTPKLQCWSFDYVQTHVRNSSPKSLSPLPPCLSQTRTSTESKSNQKGPNDIIPYSTLRHLHASCYTPHPKPVSMVAQGHRKNDILASRPSKSLQRLSGLPLRANHTSCWPMGEWYGKLIEMLVSGYGVRCQVCVVGC
jgi:hypothetical protein